MRSPLPNPFVWPFAAAAEASATSARFLSAMAGAWTRHGRIRPESPPPTWTTPNKVALDLPSMQLRDFSTQTRGPATLICAPYALHGASVVDFAPGHSVVEALLIGGINRAFVTDWRSATPEMRYFSIDTYLAELNVAVDEIGPPVDIVGLCQGGWMALIYAARFPGKVRRLVLVGAPIDIRSGQSPLSRLTADLPFASFESLVNLGGGRAFGESLLELSALVFEDEATRVLQLEPGADTDNLPALEQRFRDWYAWTLDLPGTYYLEVVRHLFKENQIAEGRFTALGQTIDLSKVNAPMFLLAALDDEIVSPGQLFATAQLIGSPDNIEMATEPCGHLSLFLGARTLGRTWHQIARWLRDDQILRRHLKRVDASDVLRDAGPPAIIEQCQNPVEKRTSKREKKARNR